MLALALLSIGCLESLPPSMEVTPDAAVVTPSKKPSWTGMMATGSDEPDGGVPPESADGGSPAPDLLPAPPPDLRPTDLLGLINCYDKAFCDLQMFCMRYFAGSPGKPGPEKGGASCYAPTDPCANGVLDCACIQADPNLGLACAQCFDNQDGSFTCYEK